MNSLTMKIIAFFISLFIILMVVSQIYFIFNNKKRTEQAVFYNVSDTLSFDGIFVRNEKVIPFQGNGVLNYLNPDGSKIAKNSVVAQAYSTEQQIDKISEIEKLEKEQKLIQGGTVSVAQPELISKQIEENYLLIEDAINNNQYDKIAQLKQETLLLMHNYNLATTAEKSTDFADREKQISDKITQLMAQVQQPASTIKTENSGYFVSYTDGYEETLNLDKVNTITPEEIEKIVNTKATKNEKNVGKTFEDYKCKIVGIVNTDNNFLTNQYIKIKVDGISDIIPVYVESMTQCGDKKYKIVLSCDVLNYDLVQERVRKINIVMDEYAGIKIPRDAINFQNDVRGVYVSYGQKVVFKKVNAVFEGDDFVISKQVNDTDYVMVHDIIVFEEGKSLDAGSTK